MTPRPVEQPRQMPFMREARGISPTRSVVSASGYLRSASPARTVASAGGGFRGASPARSVASANGYRNATSSSANTRLASRQQNSVYSTSNSSRARNPSYTSAQERRAVLGPPYPQPESEIDTRWRQALRVDRCRKGAVKNLMRLGFSEEHAVQALLESDQNEQYARQLLMASRR